MTNKASQSLPLSREGITAYERGDLASAEENLAQAVELNDADVETCRYYGETLWKRGKRAQAIKVLTDAAEKNGAIDAQASLCHSLGEKELALDQPNLALQWANKAIDLSPKNAANWELRGQANRRLNLLNAALDDFQRAAHFALDDREALREIAAIQFELGDFESSLSSWQCLERRYSTNREPAEVFAGKGSAYAALGLTKDAQEAFEIAVRNEPKNADYWVALAEIALGCGDVKRASAAIGEVAKLEPTNPRGQALAATLRTQTRQVAETTEGALR